VQEQQSEREEDQCGRDLVAEEEGGEVLSVCSSNP
jgi:hypothetical protein